MRDGIVPRLPKTCSLQKPKPAPGRMVHLYFSIRNHFKSQPYDRFLSVMLGGNYM